MPKLSLAAAAALALVFARGARAELNLYAELDGGPSWQFDEHVSDHRGPSNAELRYEHGDGLHDLGLNGQGAIGLHINRKSKNSFRVDVSGGYHRNDIKRLEADGGFVLAHGGHTSITAAMLNGYYEYDFGDLAWVKAFIGGGLGVGFLDYEPGRSSSLVQINDDATEFAFHATAGVALPIGNHVDLTGAVRYFGTTSPRLSATQRDPNTGMVTESGSVQADVGMIDLLFGVRVTF